MHFPCVCGCSQAVVAHAGLFRQHALRSAGSLVVAYAGLVAHAGLAHAGLFRLR